MVIHDHAPSCKANRSALNHQVLIERLVPELVRKTDRNLAAFEHCGAIEPLALLVAHLEQISPGSKHRMFSKFVADFDGRYGGDLKLHELLDAADSVCQFLVDRV